MSVISGVPVPSSKLLLLVRHPVFWILLVGLLAMGGALRADFYMDDYAFILNSKGDAPNDFRWNWGGKTYGSEAVDAMNISPFQLIPTGLTLLTNWLFPLNPVAAHVWNLSIHLILAVMVFRLGERLLAQLQLLSNGQKCRQAAAIGAMLFACHPLGTEPVHYAKCHMVQLVALFSFWATCEMAQFLTRPTRRSGLRFLLASGLCVISYFPGTVLLGFNLLILLGFSMTKDGGGRFRRLLQTKGTLRRPVNSAGLLLVIGVLGYLGWYFVSIFASVLENWGEFYPIHVITQGRVFWEYVQRIFIPAELASDHYQPWSTYRDTGALLGLAGLALLVLGAFTMALRQGAVVRRGVGLLMSFCLIPFAMRLLYVNIEIMVEYRAYHALPWIGLLAGCGLTNLAARIPSAKLCWLPVTVIVLGFTLLSAARGRVWRSGALLAENVLSQYPFNNRARTQLQSFALDAGDYASVLNRHEEILKIRDQINELNAKSMQGRYIDSFRADSNVIASYQFAILARAEWEGCVKALVFAKQSIASLKTLLPGQFVLEPGSKISPAWPVIEAQATVERALAAGYQGNAGSLVPAQ